MAQAKKLVLTETDILNLNVTEVTILSKAEYDKYRLRIPTISESWWLRTPASVTKGAHVVYKGCVLNASLNDDDNYIRPALKVDNLAACGLQPRDKVKVAGFTWTVIGDDLLLCDKVIGKSPFTNNLRSPVAACYEASDIAAYLKGWAVIFGLVEPLWDQYGLIKDGRLIDFCEGENIVDAEDAFRETWEGSDAFEGAIVVNLTCALAGL